MRFIGKSFYCPVFFLTLSLSGMAQQAEQLTSYVNPFIGTGAVDGSSLSGNNFPGPTVPFGMVQLSPDTKETPGWTACSGYDHNDKDIYGFSHTHLSGTGVAELFDVLLMPFSGAANFPIKSPFSHQQESARPGYYQVNLAAHNIKAELTATAHAGFHQYSFPAGAQQRLLVDLNHSIEKGSWDCRVIAAQVKIVNDHAIEGYRLITGWARLRKVYFYAEFSRPIIASELMEGNTVYRDQPVINGTNVKAIFDFDSSSEPLYVKVGISPVSTKNARENLLTEIPAWDFNRTVAEASQLWENELQKIKIDGTDVQKRIFYTALYHAFTQPNKLSDVNGDYMAADYTTQNSPEGFYSTFSLWDIYRAAAPLYTLLQPQKTKAFVSSMLDHQKAFGFLPVWELWGQENYCMIGNHAIPVIVDAVLGGIEGIDPEEAYEAVKSSSLVNHVNSPFDVWEKYRYMPENLQSQSVSLTLEMCYDDWCVAQLAKKLGKTEDYERFMARSEFYRNIYDPATGFFRAKDDKGNWLEPFNPLDYGANGGHPFTEGNAWQYFWYVPQNIPSLIGLVGGKDKFIKKLDSLFTLNDNSVKRNGNASGFIGQYAHGNEPSHHIAYLYNYAGAPWKTQYYVTKIMSELYNDSFSGYAGNEDCGQMASWYVFSAMGFYPVTPASGVYAIGSPLLKEATMQLPNGKTFTVTAKNVSDKNIYIQSATLNGVKYTQASITRELIEKGGTLVFTMGAKPSKTWGIQ